MNMIGALLWREYKCVVCQERFILNYKGVSLEQFDQAMRGLLSQFAVHMRGHKTGGVKMETRFDTVTLDREASTAKKAIKAKLVELDQLITNSFAKGVSRSQALLKLEEAWAWVSKAARVATESR